MNRLNASSILTTLAALGTSALMGCAANTPSPVQANEVAGPSADGKSAAGCGAAAGCSAGGCGAKTETKGNEAASPDGVVKTDAPADAKGDPKADATKTDTSATPKPVAKKKVMAKKGGQGAVGGCGAGTCAADAPAAPAKK